MFGAKGLIQGCPEGLQGLEGAPLRGLSLWNLAFRRLPDSSGASRVGAETLLPTQNEMSILLRFAQLADEWITTRSAEAQDALLKALAEDVRAPWLGGRGRESVRRGLEMLAARFDHRFRLTVGELEARPVLLALAQQDDGHWQTVGYFVVEMANNGAIAQLDYYED